MATGSEATKAPGMVPDDLKMEPRSKGLTTPRKKKPKELAVITECCTGCAGSPACVEYCPVEDCMFWIEDVDHPPFGRIEVDPLLCIGCKKCLSKGPEGCLPGRLSLGCNRDGRHSRSRKRSRPDDLLVEVPQKRLKIARRFNVGHGLLHRPAVEFLLASSQYSEGVSGPHEGGDRQTCQVCYRPYSETRLRHDRRTQTAIRVCRPSSCHSGR